MEKIELEKEERKSLMKNRTFLKVLSVVLAVLLWLYVVVTQDPTRTSKVDNVEVICGLSQYQINEGLNIISKSDDKVSFSATGKRSLVTGVKGSYYAKLDLQNISEPGKYNIAPQISKPEGVYVSGVSPSVIEVYVDKYVSSTVPLITETRGTLSKDLIITGMTTDVSQAVLQLPSLALGQIAYVGAVVDLSNIKSSEVINCTPVLFDAEKKVIDIKNVVMDIKNIVVTITVEKVKNVKIIPSIEGLEKFGGGLTVNVLPKSIDICGDKEILDAIESVSTKPIKLKKNVTAGEELQVALQLPAGTKLKDSSLGSVKIVFSER